MRWIDVICCNGRLCGEYVQSLGFPAERITYGYMAADVNGFKNAAQSILHACELALNNRKGRDGCAFTLQILPNHKQGEKVTYQERSK